MRYIVSIVVAGALLGIGAGARYVAPTPPPLPPERPNVVVILIDTLRPGYMGLFGHNPNTTPFLTQLAEDAVLFERAFSTSSWTAPSTASIFTSLYPFQHGVTQGFYAHREAMFFEEQHGGNALAPLNAMPKEVPTLPEVMREAGYATFGVSANRNIAEEMGFARGFDRFVQKTKMSAGDVYGVLKSWRREIEGAKPYFLYVHLMDVHWPYVEHAPYYARYKAAASDDYQAQYLSEIRYTDRWLERMTKLLNVRKNTLLVFLSDHGEEFGDHGSTQHGPTLYQELNHVLMLAYGPGLGVAPRRVRENVSLIDVLPTLAEVAGAEIPKSAVGRSLRPLLVGDAADDTVEFLRKRILFGHRARHQPPYPVNWSAMLGPWKYIEHVDKDPELYNHDDDWDEQIDVVNEHPEIVENLAAALTTARDSVGEFQGQSIDVELDQELLDTLESLGYVE